MPLARISNIGVSWFDYWKMAFSPRLFGSAPHRTASLGRAATLADRLRQIQRGRQFQQAVQFGQVVAEQAIEAGYRMCRVVIAKPPEPVGAFARAKLFFGRFLFGWTEPGTGHDHIEALLGDAQQLPCAILVRRAYPG